MIRQQFAKDTEDFSVPVKVATDLHKNVVIYHRLSSAILLQIQIKFDLCVS